MEHRVSGGGRVALFGGSFDPPHLGHLAVARAARAALSLDTVLFAPVGAQPLKPAGSTASFEDRVAMTRLAIAGEPGFTLSLIDAPQPGSEPNYTLNTLLSLRAGLPPECELFCLMGADSFLSLRRWHGAAEIPFAAALIVASRPAHSGSGPMADDLAAALPQGLHMEAASGSHGTHSALPGSDSEARTYLLRNDSDETAPLYVLPGLYVDISASQIRDQIREQTQTPMESSILQPRLLPVAVLDYIRAHGLYR